MSCAYDELYLPLAQRVMGDMYDYAVNTLRYTLEQFQQFFLISDLSKQIAAGNPTYIAGKNGCEIAKSIVAGIMGEYPETEDIMYIDKSREYWIGWSLAYFQWDKDYDFQSIEKAIPITQMYGMYPTYHEADISMFVQAADEKYRAYYDHSQLRRLRKYAGFTQKMLSEKSGVPVRQIQLFEQGQRDIGRCQSRAVLELAKALKCSVEELIR